MSAGQAWHSQAHQDILLHQQIPIEHLPYVPLGPRVRLDILSEQEHLPAELLVPITRNHVRAVNVRLGHVRVSGSPRVRPWHQSHSNPQCSRRTIVNAYRRVGCRIESLVREDRLRRGGQDGLGDVYEVVSGRGGWARGIVDVHLGDTKLMSPVRMGVCSAVWGWASDARA